MSLTSPLIAHHKHCDDLFANAEAAAHAGRWDQCADVFGSLDAELSSHFAAEEQHLFPAFEAATGMTGGPTQVMRFEHRQMLDLLAQMRSALAEQALEPFAGACETLLVLMQQHNMKEENILYPMCDRSVDANALDLAGELVAQPRSGACPV